MYGSHDGMYGASEPDGTPEQCAVFAAAQLDAYHDGLLPANDARVVASHVAVCAQCAAHLEALAAADRLIRSASAPRVGPELRQRLYARIAAARSATQPATALIHSSSERRMNDTESDLPRVAATRSPPRKLSVWVSSIAAALIVALLAGVFLAQGHGLKHGGPTVGNGNTPAPATGACAPNAIKANLPAHAYLADMAMTSATDGWAVGAVRDSANDAPDRSLVLHFSACHWTEVGPSLPAGSLLSISMDSPTDGWIAGTINDTHGVLLHYSGGRWQQMHIATLDNTNGVFSTVRMLSPTEGWMVIMDAKNAQGLSSTALAHDSNGTWSVVSAPPISVIDFAPVGTDDVWVIGTASNADVTGMLAHYQSGRWVARVSMGSHINTINLSLRMLTATDGWAMAETPGPGDNYFEGVEKALVLHYDGTAWKPVTTGANPADQRVSIFGAGEGWAFNFTHRADDPNPDNVTISLAQYENGGTWQTVTMPANDINGIAGLSRVAAGEYWAIGTYQVYSQSVDSSGGTSGVGYNNTVLLHYINGVWTQYGR